MLTPTGYRQPQKVPSLKSKTWVLKKAPVFATVPATVPKTVASHGFEPQLIGSEPIGLPLADEAIKLTSTVEF